MREHEALQSGGLLNPETKWDVEPILMYDVKTVRMISYNFVCNSP